MGVSGWKTLEVSSPYSYNYKQNNVMKLFPMEMCFVQIDKNICVSGFCTNKNQILP